jgi:transcriptional regulator with GAF, ATPase, and Fis domain
MAAAPVNSAQRSDTPLFTRAELKQRERESIAVALAQAGGKISGVNGAAALLGMKRTTLASRIKALGLLRSKSRSVFG